MDKKHYAYDLEFQKHLLASFLADEKFLREHLEIFQPEYFGDDPLQALAGVIREFFEKHGEIPQKEAVLQEVKGSVMPGTKLVSYEELIAEVYERVGVNSSYYQDKAIEFAKVHILHNALRECFLSIEQGEVEEVEQTFSKAIKDCEKADLNGHYDYFKGVEARAEEYFDQRHHKEKSGRISTGFPALDDRLQGGLGAGETGVIIAPAKHGKTASLISLAVPALIREKKVLYVTLELSEKVIASRFDSNLTGCDLETMRKKPKRFQEQMEKIMEKLNGRLTIAWFPTKTLVLSRLHATISKVKPDIVFVDHATNMKPGKNRDDRRFEISDIHEGLRSIAGECQIPLWTAHQANRVGFGVKVLEMQHIAEDISVAGIADIIISVNQTSEEKRRGVLQLHIAGNRLGGSGDSIACDVNWVISKITPSFGEDEDLG
jgi:replicative DNA helicase